MFSIRLSWLLFLSMVVFSVLAFVCLGLLPSTSSGSWAPIDQTTIGHVAQSAGQHQRHPAADPAQTAHQATLTNLPSTRPRNLMERNERQRAPNETKKAALPEPEAAHDLLDESSYVVLVSCRSVCRRWLRCTLQRPNPHYGG
eukprot:GHVS01078325.1.p1 GENE.GHVS01078325.1~~GHVS01078325.1.p1  ORF type:complete len:166 (+),score=16.82 GHVS01078325.1:70-498(+)